MMLDHLGEAAAARQLMSAIAAVTESGLHTPDLGGTATTGQITDAVIALINR
ncbi:putative tartrate dehydrogenase/decarboxylase TtuC' [compost metagenome]